MILKKLTIFTALIVLAVSCRERYKNPEPAPDETNYKSSGKIGGADVSFNSGVNGYNPYVRRDSAQNYVTYTFGIRTSSPNEDYFILKVSGIDAGLDSNDIDDLFEVVANQTVGLAEVDMTPVVYSFSYFKGGVEYFPKKSQSGNITFTSHTDLGDIKAVDHVTGQEFSSRYVQFNAQLDNVTLFNTNGDELLIEKFGFVGKFAAFGDMKRKNQ